MEDNQEKTPEEILAEQEALLDEENETEESEKEEDQEPEQSKVVMEPQAESKEDKITGKMDKEDPEPEKEVDAYQDIYNPLVHMFTAQESMVSYLRDRLAYNFELMLYDYYKVRLPIWSVKCTVVPVEQLTRSSISKIYNEYVEEAKELPEGYYGIQAVFDVDTSG